jgi:hypothetical protein
MRWYINLVTSYPILSAVIQFAVLGTAGEMLAARIANGKRKFHFTLAQLLSKALIWAILAVCIKYAFVGFKGFVDALMHHGYLPWLHKFTRAFAISAFMNLQFGPFLVVVHRLLDNLVAGESNWKKLDKALFTLIWFWIPAHTITFSLPLEFQIGLAAVWSVVLGVILGFYNQRPAAAEQKKG